MVGSPLVGFSIEFVNETPAASVPSHKAYTLECGLESRPRDREHWALGLREVGSARMRKGRTSSLFRMETTAVPHPKGYCTTPQGILVTFRLEVSASYSIGLLLENTTGAYVGTVMHARAPRRPRLTIGTQELVSQNCQKQAIPATRGGRFDNLRLTCREPSGATIEPAGVWLG